MKKTKHINLQSFRKYTEITPTIRPIVLAIAGASLFLASCGGGKEEAYVANTAEDCAENTELTLDQCEIAYKQALVESAKTAPRYNSRNSCEQDFGSSQCYRSNSSGFFIPLMAGYLIGNLMGGNNYNPVYGYSGSNSGLRNNYVLSDGTSIGSRNNKYVHVNKSDVRKSKPKATTTVSRGGFGSSASAKSSWGTTKSRSSWGG
ncbi:MAG: DUF1190 domain-containing protein [Saccharospirillaceae bacterium]|nr:DUF1190 domain-containing protein [Pseudomonadales bacterium]NRB79508.1 DUF1190 domain-containing protein [Saccharospirillaceae bacterium]